MPYARSLQQYLAPEIFVEPPDAWERRLREISPVTDRLQHLRFRFRAGSPTMLHPDAQRRGVWELYACTPRPRVSQDRAKQFTLHWSELPTDQQPGRRALVSSYQHYMWHVHGVEVRRCWVLQGEQGGTPAAYTDRERRLLDAEGWLSEPLPIGALPPCPFNEETVNAVQSRDLLVQAGNSVDELERRNSATHLRIEEESAEKEFRKRFLGWWQTQMAPQAEFMKWYLTKSEADHSLRRATNEEANAVTTWKDQYIEHGSVPMAGIASSQAVPVAVK